MLTVIVALLRDRKGATAIEYGLVIALIAIAAIVAIVSVGTTTSTMWNNVSTAVQQAG